MGEWQLSAHTGLCYSPIIKVAEPFLFAPCDTHWDTCHTGPINLLYSPHRDKGYIFSLLFYDRYAAQSHQSGFGG